MIPHQVLLQVNALLYWPVATTSHEYFMPTEEAAIAYNAGVIVKNFLALQYPTVVAFIPVIWCRYLSVISHKNTLPRMLLQAAVDYPMRYVSFDHQSNYWCPLKGVREAIANM